MIKILPNKKQTEKTKPYYELKLNYMIGDADGTEIAETKVELDDLEILERFLKILNILKPNWTARNVVLSDWVFEDKVKCGKITKDDFEFLQIINGSIGNVYLSYEEGMKKYGKSYSIFDEIIRDEIELGQLSFESWELKYVDEYGEKFNCVLE